MKYKYCPLCGSEMETFEDGGFVRERCSKCGWVHYRNPRPTSSAVIARSGKVLLMRRAIDPQKGKWDVPGGFLEEQESPVEAVKREVEEELGVRVKVGRLVGVFGPTYYPFAGQGVYNLDLFYEATVSSGEPVIQNDEATELRWFSPDDLPAIAFPSVVEAISEWARIGQNT